MAGGLGDDWYWVDSVADNLTEYVNEGLDTVVFSPTGWYTLPDNVENLIVSVGVAGTGNWLANEITGNSRNNVLDGGAGADTLVGGAGDDIYIVDDSGDSVVEEADAGFDEVHSSVTYSLGPNVENLMLTGTTTIDGTGDALDNLMVGNSAANVLTAGAGNDGMDGGEGNDWLSGDDGNDTLFSGAGNDGLAGGAGNDTYYFDRLSGHDAILELQENPGDIDTLIFGADIGRQDLVVTRSGPGNANLLVSISGSPASILFNQWFNPEIPSHVERFVFSDGTVLGDQDIEAMINDAPVANPDAACAAEDGTTANLVPLLLANDTDADAGDTLGITAVDTAGTVGTVAFNAATQTLTYAADAAAQDALATGETASDAFSYTVTDSHGETSTAAVTVTVTGVNDAPVAAADSVAVAEDATTANLAAVLLANDTDADNGDQRRITAVDTTGTSGTVSFNASTQTLTYSADAAAQDALSAGQSATDHFAYGVTDLFGVSSTATVTVTVTGVNDAPVVAVPIADQSATENRVFAFQVPGSAFSDVDSGDTLAYSATLASGAALPGWLMFDAASRTFVGMPGDGDLGTISVRVTAADTHGASASDVFDIGIVPMSGTEGDDDLLGTASRDRIFGLSGNDTLNGAGGADTLIGGTGNDTYLVDDAGDAVIEAAGEGSDTVVSVISYTLGTNVENLALAGTAAIDGTGNEVDNILAGNSAANGLAGGAGNDTYFVSAGDTVTEAAGAGTDTVVSDVTRTLSSNLENLTLAGTAAINGTGNTLDNVIRGNSAANALAGGQGNDTYFVSTGDTVTEAASAGTDTVVSDVAWTLGSNLENLVLAGSANINGTGNTLANVITGNFANNILSGGSGSDTLNGGAGNDTLDGGSGADAMSGGLGDDTYAVGSTSDSVTELANEGTDTVR
jgi:VCBS repeat-containing protein